MVKKYNKKYKTSFLFFYSTMNIHLVIYKMALLFKSLRTFADI